MAYIHFGSSLPAAFLPPPNNDLLGDEGLWLKATSRIALTSRFHFHQVTNSWADKVPQNSSTLTTSGEAGTRLRTKRSMRTRLREQPNSPKICQLALIMSVGNVGCMPSSMKLCVLLNHNRGCMRPFPLPHDTISLAPVWK